MKFVYTCGSLQPADQEAVTHFLQMREGDVIGLDPVKTRTTKQNSSMWLYCALMAKRLEAAGFDMRTFPFREGLQIPFTKNSVMETFWRPIQDAMFGKESTTKLSTKESKQVYEAMDRAISERVGIHVPWPCEDSLMQEQEVA